MPTIDERSNIPTAYSNRIENELIDNGFSNQNDPFQKVHPVCNVT